MSEKFELLTDGIRAATKPERLADSTCAAVTPVMPSRCTASTGTLVWNARLARMAAFCAAS